MITRSYGTTTYEDIRSAMTEDCYQMELVGDDAKAVEAAVNRGIDGHLEACNCPGRGDKYEWVKGRLGPRLHCTVSAASLPVLLRRLLEMQEAEELSEEAEGLRGSILETLGIEEV